LWGFGAEYSIAAALGASYMVAACNMYCTEVFKDAQVHALALLAEWPELQGIGWTMVIGVAGA